MGRGKAAAQLILTQPAKSSLLPLLLPTLLLLKPLLLLLTSQMATLGLTQRLRLLGLTSQRLGLTSQLLGLTSQLLGLTSQLLGLTSQDIQVFNQEGCRAPIPGDFGPGGAREGWETTGKWSGRPRDGAEVGFGRFLKNPFLGSGAGPGKHRF